MKHEERKKKTRDVGFTCTLKCHAASVKFVFTDVYICGMTSVCYVVSIDWGSNERCRFQGSCECLSLFKLFGCAKENHEGEEHGRGAVKGSMWEW